MASRDSTRTLPASANLTDLPFGLWIVLREAAPRKSRRYWHCRCECGTESVVDGKELRIGRSNSCISCRNRTHGMCNSVPEYIIWKLMRSRCNNPSHKNYDRYGGRGITICPEWDSFEVFYADMGPRPTPKHTIDRKKNDLGYCKDNCRWATRKEQSRNTSRNRILTFKGVTQSLPDWAEQLGIAQGTLTQRIRSGWTVERTLTTPVRQRERSHVRPPSSV